MKKLRYSALLLVFVLLGACSNTFVYNQLDWVIPWYVDDYVDLTRDQKRSLKDQLQPLLLWHRNEELASYIEILDGIEADLREPVSSETIESWANKTLAAYERLEERMLPLAFELGNELSDRQMTLFRDGLRRDQRELEDEYLGRTDEEYVAESLENFTDNLGDFLGRLSGEQLAVLETAAAALQRFDAAWLEERRLWLEQLDELLQREPGWEDAVRQALAQRDANRTQAYRDAYAHNAVIINGSIAEVLNLRSEKQSRRLQREMDDLRRDLRKLVDQGEDSSSAPESSSEST